MSHLLLEIGAPQRRISPYLRLYGTSLFRSFGVCNFTVSDYHAQSEDAVTMERYEQIYICLREVVKDVFSGPMYREGYFMMVLKDTRPGINNSSLRTKRRPEPIRREFT